MLSLTAPATQVQHAAPVPPWYALTPVPATGTPAPSLTVPLTGLVAVTVKLVVAEWLRLPLVPVTVIVELPVGVLEIVVTVIVEVEVAGLGLKVASAPAGSPPALSCTAPLNVAVGPMVTV